jgi:alpha-tubulin suppressor-like RCC1 family protein
MTGNGHVRFGGRPRGKGPALGGHLAAWPTLPAPCSSNGPTPAPTAAKPPADAPSPDGSTSTITTGPTPRSAANHPSAASPTSVDTTRYSSIDLGYHSACAVATSGRLACWGWNGFFVLGLGDSDARMAPTILPEINWRSVSVSGNYACGVRTRSTTMTDERYCWGLNALGQLGDGTTTDRATPRLVDDGPWSLVSTGRRHACGISPGRYLYCWGDNYHGQLGVGKDVVSDHTLEPILVR